MMDNLDVEEDNKKDEVAMETEDVVIESNGNNNNNGPIPEVALPTDDETNNNEPEFIHNFEDYEEVMVDHDNLPMDDEDDDDDEDQQQPERMNRTEVDEESSMMKESSVEDMSNYQITSAHVGPVYTIASYYNRTTQTLWMTSGGGDDKAYLHSISSSLSSPYQHESKLLQHVHTDSVSAVAFNVPYISSDMADSKKNPRLLAVGGYDGAIVLYQADTGEHITQLEGPSDVEWFCFHPKGGTVLLVGSATDHTIWMYHMISPYPCLQVFVGHENSVTQGMFSIDGRWAITGSLDGTIRIWAPRTGICKHIYRFPTSSSSSGGIISMSTNMDGQLLIAGTEDGYAHICHVGNKKVLTSLRHYEPPSTLLSNNNNNNNGNNGHYDEEMTLDLPMSVEAVGFASSSSNLNWCATGGVDGILKIWDLSIGNGQCRQICSVSMANNNRSNKDTNTTIATTTSGGITKLQWHPTLLIVFTATTSGTIYIWDARNGNLLQTLTGSTEVINDMQIQIIDPITDNQPQQQQQQQQTILILTGSDDHVIRIHEVNTNSLLQHQQSH
jgi:angio-associated migratory cell protein